MLNAVTLMKVYHSTHVIISLSETCFLWQSRSSSGCKETSVTVTVVDGLIFF